MKFYNQNEQGGEGRVQALQHKGTGRDRQILHQFDVLVLDEAVCAADLGLLSEEKLIHFLQHKPRGLEVVMTGHHVSDELMQLANYATEMRKVKHPYDEGRSARAGIEF